MIQTKDLKLKPNEEIVVIIGYSATGKTTIAKYLSELYPDFQVVSTDDYIEYGYKESVYQLLGDVRHMYHVQKKKLIIEGIQGYRLLRKGISEGLFYADVVFIIECEPSIRQLRYIRRGHQDKLSQMQSFDKSLQTIWFDYRNRLEDIQDEIKIPRIVKIQTNE